MGLTLETPPDSFTEVEREWLTRRFVEVGAVLDQPSKHPERHRMPYKPRFGDIHYYGDPLTHSYDAVITSHGLWAFIEILPATDPRTGEWLKIV